MTKQEIEAVMDAHEERHHRKTDGKLWTFAIIADKFLRVAVVGVLIWAAKEIYQNKGQTAEIAVIIKQLQVNQQSIVTTQKDLQVWRAATSANRFTVKDGADLLARHVSDIDSIKAGQAEIIRSIAELPSKLPPQWVKDRIDDNSQRVKDLERRMDTHERGH